MSQPPVPFAPEFKRWADTFPADVRVFSAIVDETRLPADVRKLAAGALNYLLMQMDVIPDHVPVLGVLDDAFVLRVAAALILQQDAAGTPTEIARMANDDERVLAFLGKEQYDLLRSLVQALTVREIRKRTPSLLIESERERRDFGREIEAQIAQVRSGAIDDAAKLERDLRSYFQAKLGRV